MWWLTSFQLSFYRTRRLSFFFLFFLDEKTLNGLAIFFFFFFIRIKVKLLGRKAICLYLYFIIFRWFILWILRKNPREIISFLWSIPTQAPSLSLWSEADPTLPDSAYFNPEIGSTCSGLTPASQWEICNKSSMNFVGIKSTVALKLINFYVYYSPWWKMTHCAVWEDTW